MDADKNFHCSYQPSNLVSFLRLNEKYDVNRKALWREKHFSRTLLLNSAANNTLGIQKAYQYNFILTSNNKNEDEQKEFIPSLVFRKK